MDTAASWGLLLPNGEWRLKSPREMERLWQGRERGLEAAAAVASDCGAFDLRWLRPPCPTSRCRRGRRTTRTCAPWPSRGRGSGGGSWTPARRRSWSTSWGSSAAWASTASSWSCGTRCALPASSGILCQGRGSAANSAVAYCLGITAVDPVRHGLLFERFLSEVRTDGMTEAPDIDVDFEMHRREEVLDYMYAPLRPLPRGDHGGAPGVPRAQRAAGLHAGAGLPGGDGLRALQAAAWPARRVKARRCWGRAGRDPPPGAGRAARPRAPLRPASRWTTCRACAPPTPAASCSPAARWARGCPSSTPPWGAPSSSSTRTTWTPRACPSSTSWGSAACPPVHLAFDAIERRTGEHMELYSCPWTTRAPTT